MTQTPLTANIRLGQPLDLGAYERAGGYRAARRAVTQMTPAEVIDLVTQSKLRGRGGAGFSTGLKWSLVPSRDAVPPPRYLVVNADEMEPGTFKDRLLLEGDPHQMVEAIIVAAYAIQANIAYFFLRGEYHLAPQRLQWAIDEAAALHYIGPYSFGTEFSLSVHVHTSGGRYICGEETALLTALEGNRAIPRAKPPFPQISGLWGRPTVVHNVE